jgi:hypothetical protein
MRVSILLDSNRWLFLFHIMLLLLQIQFTYFLDLLVTFLPSRVEDIFFNLKLDHVPIRFSTMNEKERWIMKIIL